MPNNTPHATDSNSTEKSHEPDAELPFGNLLRFWRGVYELSQEELAFRLESSPRHISRLENSRVHPSKAITQKIGRVLGLGERDCNQLIVAAGYTPTPSKADFLDPNLKWLRKAMSFKLRAIEPYPAILVDSCGKILMLNRGWLGFYGALYPDQDLSKNTNYFEFLFEHRGTSADLVISDNILVMILMALQQSALIRNDEKIQHQLNRLQKSPNAPQDWARRAAALQPMSSFPIQAKIFGSMHKFYDISQTVGAIGPAAYVSEPHITMHTLYPENDELDLSSLCSQAVSHPFLC